MRADMLRTGLPRGAHVERLARTGDWADRALRWTGDRLVPAAGTRRAASTFLARVTAEGAAFADASDEDLAAAAGALRAALRLEGLGGEAAARAFALVCELAHRRLGQRPYDVQVRGGWLLMRGRIVEMETGEGKTLTATLPAATVALSGHPVHVVTVNDYLAQRDAETLGPLYAALGLSVGVVTGGMPGPARRAAYACDITYCTNKQLVFDYLRDRITLGRGAGRVRLALEALHAPAPRAAQLMQRGLHYAIVDEADSVLIDEARTPLIISDRAGAAEEERAYRHAHALASAFRRDTEFVIDTFDNRVRLTEGGQRRLAEEAGALGGVWSSAARREDLVRQALTALHLFHRDRHYLIEDGKVAIIDEYTGRVMPDRSWEHGLHQAIELKEGCALTVQTAPLARISYQRFFRRYVRLSGMTGTAREVAGELRSVYGPRVVRVPTHRPTRRTAHPDRLYARGEDRWAAVVERVRVLHAEGRPVLIGTRSVEASEILHARLEAAGLAHRVLNARQDEDEASIVSEAGQPGHITVATNMAGRGTDIRLGPGVAEAGGLAVIATERHESARIDRQLFGRCGRQGDPGSHEVLLSLDDELFTLHGQPARVERARARAGPDGCLPGPLAAQLVRDAQAAAERRHARIRRDLLRLDEQHSERLAFSGRAE